MSGELADFANRVSKITDPKALSRMAAKGGAAGKKAALEAAADDLGGDRRMSNLRRKTALGAGWDDTGNGQVTINFRPPGLWKLAEAGRRKSGPIYPRGGNRKGKGVVYRRAVMTPQGPRAHSSFRPSRGLHTFTDAVKDARREVPKAAAKQFTQEVRKVVR